MTPILIEPRRLTGIALLLLLGMGALFFGGYFIGFYKAEAFQDKSPRTVRLALPDATIHPAAADVLAYLPGELEPGIDRDVDAPDKVSPAGGPLAETGTKASTKAGATVQKAVVAPAVDEVQTQHVAVGGPLVSEEEELALLADTAEEALARYSIQVGVFSTEDNAERRVEDLLAQRLSAYSSEYINKQRRQMYNVRFGYYASYRDAKAALDVYRTALSGDGYIVKLKK